MQRLLLAETAATQSLWRAAGWHKLLLSQALTRS
jgi:hypothetical protein